MTSKKSISEINKVEYFKHPFSKKKLKTTDIFHSNKNFTCTHCSAIGRPIIYCISSDISIINGYFVLKCKGCEQATWHVNSHK